jgi:hypothetical protein
MKESIPVKELESMWNLEDDENEGKQSAWDTESGWVHDAHLLPLDEIRSMGYPSESKGNDEKELGKTGLGRIPSGLNLIWADLAQAWDISIAKLQRITTCHGLCILGKDELFLDIRKLYHDSMKTARGMKDPAYMEDLESSFLLYQFFIPSGKYGGSISFLKNRLGMIGQVNKTLGVAQATTWIELSIISIMTIESKELGKWKNTISREQEKFREFMEIRKNLLERWYDKHNG